MSDFIPPEELIIETYPYPKDHGGQTAGGVRFGVKVTHVPTGIIAIVESERSQLRNRDVAIDMILGGLTSPRHRT